MFCLTTAFAAGLDDWSMVSVHADLLSNNVATDFFKPSKLQVLDIHSYEMNAFNMNLHVMCKGTGLMDYKQQQQCSISCLK